MDIAGTNGHRGQGSPEIVPKQSPRQPSQIDARIARASERRTTGFVYFLRCEHFVKVGYSESSPRYRPKTFETGNPFDCVLIGIVEGGMLLEKELHKEFASSKHPGRREWFHLTPEIERRITELCGDWSGVALGPFGTIKATAALFDFSHLVPAVSDP